MKDNKEFASFLMDKNRNDEIFQNYYGKLKIHKENHNNRFDIIYTKKYIESLYQENYEVSGYYDLKDNRIYNFSYSLESIVKDNPTIKLDYFSTIHKKMFMDIEKYITKYSFENQKQLKKLALEEFNNYSPSEVDYYKKTVKTEFIKKDNPQIKFDAKINKYNILNKNDEYLFNLYINYLINPEDVIKQCAEKFIQNNKEELGVSLLVYDAQVKYLKELQTNKNNQYKDIYCIKKIYNSIKDVGAKTLKLTIEYNKNYYTFNFSYYRLINSLELCDKGSCDYGSSYINVANFIKKNSDNPEKMGYYQEFLFDNIVSITYGRNELYKKDDNISLKLKNKNKDYER